VRSAGDDFLSDVHPAQVTALKPQLEKGATRRRVSTHGGSGESAVDELNDNTFVMASDVLNDLVDAIRRDSGAPPSLDDLCALIAEGLHRCDETLIADVRPTDVAGIAAASRKQKRIQSKVGDVVAIPAENGEYFTAVVLAKNAFGTAYGLFEGTSPLRPTSGESHPSPRAHHVYSGDEAVASGRWKIIGHDDSIRGLFPAEPELYHRPRAGVADRSVPPIGRYGSAESPSRQLRHLTKEEAEDVGLLRDDFEPIYLTEMLEDRLNRELRADRT
jgi:hypothetical protein